MNFRDRGDKLMSILREKYPDIFECLNIFASRNDATEEEAKQCVRDKYPNIPEEDWEEIQEAIRGWKKAFQPIKDKLIV